MPLLDWFQDHPLASVIEDDFEAAQYFQTDVAGQASVHRRSDEGVPALAGGHRQEAVSSFDTRGRDLDDDAVETLLVRVSPPKPWRPLLSVLPEDSTR